MKYSLTPDKLDSFVPIFLDVMQNYVDNAKDFQGNEGTFDVIQSMAVTTIFTAAASLQGKEVREKLDHGLADLYHTLDLSFIPINFYLPGLPLPVNRRRDKAQKEIAAIYTNIIKSRRAVGSEKARDGNDDMIWSLMRSTYKDGTPVPDHEIANLMIAFSWRGNITLTVSAHGFCLGSPPVLKSKKSSTKSNSKLWMQISTFQNVIS